MNFLPPALQKWGPSIVSALVLIVIAFRDLIADNSFSLTDKYALGIAVVNAVVTWLVPNMAAGVARYVKPITHAALVALAFFLKAQTGDGTIDVTEWIDGLVLVLGALGVAITVGPVWVAKQIVPANGIPPQM